MPLLLISLDGVSSQDADRLCCLSALSSIREHGTFCRHMTGVCPMLTVPYHTSLLTGCYPDAHGIGHDSFFQPDLPPFMRRRCENAASVRMPSLHQAASEKGLSTASLLWPVSAKSAFIDRNFPDVTITPSDIPLLKMCRSGTVRWILSSELKYGKKRRSFAQPDLDDYAALLAESLYLSKTPPDLLTVRFSGSAAVRLKYGAAGSEAEEALRHVNDLLSTVIAAACHAFGNTLYICVTCGPGVENVHIPFPLDMALKAACGARAQTTGKGAFIFGSDLSAARKTLEANAERWGIAHIFDDDELRSLHAPDNVQLAVETGEGVCYVDGDDLHLAERGFLSNNMHSEGLFFLSGNQVPAGMEISRIALIDVAPTLSDYLDFSLPQAQGVSLRKIITGHENDVQE